ncbi:lytic murein transglycosylase [Agrobacterium fabrum]|nr:lytic murein transglycosylase [Agrobacterium fabrum]
MWFTPLCPAGHLPHKGGDRQDACFSLFPQHSMWLTGRHWSISLLVGEMPGRAEGVNLTLRNYPQ